MPILQFKNLALAYGDVALLDHIELTIEPSERIALIGRNGAGKSSLLKILAGLAKEDDGIISRAPNLTVALVMQEPFEWLGACRRVLFLGIDGPDRNGGRTDCANLATCRPRVTARCGSRYDHLAFALECAQ